MDKIKGFFIKIWEFIKKFHWYGWVGLVIAIVYQTLSYYISHTIADASGRMLSAFSPKIDAIDNCFPIVPFFVIFYWYSFIFWGMAILATALTEKRNFINLIFSLLLASTFGLIMFSAFPSYIDRVKEGLMDIGKQPGVFNWWLYKTYCFDGGDIGWNLLPSFHCAVALGSALGTFRRKDSPLWWRIIALVSVILIVLSTLFTKQHFFLDVITGLALALITFYTMKLIDPGKRILEKHSNKVKKV